MTLASAQAVSIKRESLGLSTPYEAPKGEMELAVAKLFAEVFGSTASAPMTISSMSVGIPSWRKP